MVRPSSDEKEENRKKIEEMKARGQLLSKAT
jgi:hypothetical protein